MDVIDAVDVWKLLVNKHKICSFFLCSQQHDAGARFPVHQVRSDTMGQKSVIDTSIEHSGQPISFCSTMGIVCRKSEMLLFLAGYFAARTAVWVLLAGVWRGRWLPSFYVVLRSRTYRSDKLFLIPNEPLQSASDASATPPLEALRSLRQKYVELLLEKMQAPDGSYADGVSIPGSSTLDKRAEGTAENLETNNPLSLHNEVRIMLS
jgi:hypothetical protein